MRPGYELFDHTADVGVRVYASNYPELIRAASEGLYSVIGELIPDGPSRAEEFHLSGGDPAELLRDYLAELLLIFERDHRMMTSIRVETFASGCLVVVGESKPVNRERSAFDREIKAVTYHGLKLCPVDGGYEATYIVDI